MRGVVIICITGMHRSGTSLIASYFQHCGIPIGERLVGPGQGNRRGHFEDYDFLEFHKEILASNKANMYNPKLPLRVSDEDRKRARKLIEKRNLKAVAWGWKEPRSTLFLDLWAEISPDIKFIFMYRDPYQVIESLYRRMKLRYKYGSPWLAPLSWIQYNEELLRFHKCARDRSVFVNIKKFNQSPEEGKQKLGDWLDIKLDKPYSDVYCPHEMRSGIDQRLPFPIGLYLSFIKSLYGNRLINIYNQLEGRSLI